MLTRHLIIASLLLWGCEQKEPFVVLSIGATAEVASALDRVTVGTGDSTSKAIALGEKKLPVTLVVQAKTPGEHKIVVEGLDAGGVVIGRGHVVARLERSGTPTATVVLRIACASDADCSDNLFCTGAESCDEGSCAAGAVPCSASFDCVVSTCAELGEGEGTCQVSADHSVCPENLYCNPDAGCVQGEGCVESVDCDDGSPCNGVEECVNFLCRPGAQPNFDDGDLCTFDACNLEQGIVHIPAANFDGNACSKVGVGREICIARQGGCSVSACGDGFVDAGAAVPELCDDGESNSDEWAQSRYCSTACTGYAPYCGDGEKDLVEFCDDGNNAVNDNDCSAACECLGLACIEEPWAGLGGSDFGPWRTSITWGSATGLGPAPSVTFPQRGEIALGPSGKIALAVGSSVPVIAQWNGSTWSNITSGLSDLNEPSVAFSAEGDPIVAWLSSSFSGSVFVKRFDGTSWVELGAGSASDTGVSGTDQAYGYLGPRIIRDVSGNIVVAWLEEVAGVNQIYVKKFSNGAWGPLYPGSASGTGISAGVAASYLFNMDSDSQGRVVIAWQSGSGASSYIYVKRLTASGGAELGVGSASGTGVTQSGGTGSSPTITVTNSDEVHVAWIETVSGGRKLYTKRFDGAAWVESGAGSASGNGVAGGNVVGVPRFSRGGAATLAWNSGVDSNTRVYIKHWTGTAWQAFGNSAAGNGVSNNSASASLLAIANDANSAPYVLWMDRGQVNGVALLRRWDGAQWSEVNIGTGSGNGVSDSPQPVSAVSLVFDDNHEPVVAWADARDGDSDIYVRRYSGGVWEDLAPTGGVSGTSSASESPQLVLLSTGELAVAWEEAVASSRYQIYVKKFNGTTWQEMGVGSASGNGASGLTNSGYRASLAAGPEGTAYLAWLGSGTVPAVCVKAFNGTTWTALTNGPSPCLAPEGSNQVTVVKLLVDSTGVLYAGWTQITNIFTAAPMVVKKWDGATWVPLDGGTSGLVAGANALGLALTLDATHRPVLVTSQPWGGGTEIVARVWTGSLWQVLVDPSDPFAVVSNNPGTSSTLPTAAVDGLGRPWVAWQEATSPSQIYLRRWLGTSWVEVGTSSATAGGVSNSTTPSTNPALAVDGSQACAAWLEPGARAQQVALRCANW